MKTSLIQELAKRALIFLNILQLCYSELVSCHMIIRKTKRNPHIFVMPVGSNKGGFLNRLLLYSRALTCNNLAVLRHIAASIG